MLRYAHGTAFALLAILACPIMASAETLRCQSVNGNVNCAGSDGVACQTINGKKTCVSGHGDVMQSFGPGKTSNSAGNYADDGTDADDEGLAGPAPAHGDAKHRDDPGSAVTR